MSEAESTSSDIAAIAAQVQALETRMEAFFGTLGRQVARSGDVGYAQIEALIGLYRELDGRTALPPMRRWAISPDAARELRRLVIERRPSAVVELGSGVSTVLVGTILRDLGVGSLVAFEHDPVFWAESTQRIAAFDLQDIVTVEFAPLVPCRVGDQEFLWYDIADWDFLEPIDLVVVDGPPETVGNGARFPALPMLRDLCSPSCVFFLDDYVRSGEQAMAARWIAEFGAEMVGFSAAPEKWTATICVRSDEEPTPEMETADAPRE